MHLGDEGACVHLLVSLEPLTSSFCPLLLSTEDTNNHQLTKPADLSSGLILGAWL